MIIQQEFPTFGRSTAFERKPPKPRPIVVDPRVLGRVLARVNVQFGVFAIMFVIQRSGGKAMIAALARETGMSRYAINNHARRSHLLKKPVLGESSISLTEDGAEMMSEVERELLALTYA